MPEEKPPQSEILLYQTEDGRTRIQCRFENETIWLTQALIAELFQKDVRTINEHLVNIYDENELDRGSTIRNFRKVRAEGRREVARDIEHYSLPAIIAVGYRVRSHRGTQFRQWATARLSEYLVKGFAMDDERLKNPPDKGQTDYFDDLLERIRDIRSSERRFYQKVLDIYATSIDYAPNTDMSQLFFATVQNKMHWAAHGHTAAEIIHQRAARPVIETGEIETIHFLPTPPVLLDLQPCSPASTPSSSTASMPSLAKSKRMFPSAACRALSWSASPRRP